MIAKSHIIRSFFVLCLIIITSAFTIFNLNSLIYLPIVRADFTPSAAPTTSIPPTPISTPLPTPLPPITGNIVITGIFYNGSGFNEPDEYVQIRNDDLSAIQLQSWTLRDQASHIFTFSSFIIQPGQVCRIYTNQIHTEWCGFNYGSNTAIWNNTGDCAYLRNSSSILIDDFCY